MGHKKDSFHFGKVSGGVIVEKGNINQAGGDIAGRDKITTTDNSKNHHGFKQEADKTQFVSEIETLRTILRSIKNEIENTTAIDEDLRDEMSTAVIQQVKELKEVKEQVATLPVGQSATPTQTQSLTQCLETTNQLMDKAHSFGEKIADLSLKVAPLIEKASPVLTTLRTLFGM